MALAFRMHAAWLLAATLARRAAAWSADPAPCGAGFGRYAPVPALPTHGAGGRWRHPPGGTSAAAEARCPTPRRGPTAHLWRSPPRLRLAVSSDEPSARLRNSPRNHPYPLALPVRSG